jgi:uncharacterized membrane protein
MGAWRRVALAGVALWLLAVGTELALGAWAFRQAGAQGAVLLAILLNGLVCLRFAVTLRRGGLPLITRYARADSAGLPAEGEAYTRRLTAIWTMLLGLFAIAQAGPLLGLWSTRAVSLTEAIACVALFLGEHVQRNRSLPQLGRATPWRTLRAIWGSYRVA